MRGFVLFTLWFSVVSVVIRFFCLFLHDEYPRSCKISRGNDFAISLFHIAIIVWAYHCIYL